MMYLVRGYRSLNNYKKYPIKIKYNYYNKKNRRNFGLFSSSSDKVLKHSQEPNDDLVRFGDKSALTKYIRKETDSIFENILLPLNNDYRGPLEETNTAKATPLPFVFLLGNHSSGKSSFINHVLERRVQNTGVAPTDDGFTIILPGENDLDQAGPSLVGDPDLGFSGLRAFGPNLIHLTKLKVRKDLAMQDVMLIDSPGMIDSPIDSGSSQNDRGYDFQAVTRWFAERADVILLFFDPDKPGTTGETLNVLTSSLAGMDHKLHIILNKVDQFKKIHDFARAYGSLCWNVSKVIPRKDLPKIYTMYTPVTMDKGNANRVLKHQDDGRRPEPFNVLANDLSWSAALRDLEDMRNDVIDEVKRAPDRRIDNMITHLYDSTRLLRMHLVMCEAVRQDFNMQSRRTTLTAIGVGTAGCTVSLLSLYLMPAVWSFAAVLSVSSLAGSGGVYLYGNFRLQEQAKTMSDDAYLDSLFTRIYIKEISENDQFVNSLWKRIKLQLKSTIDTIGPANIPKVRNSELGELDAILDFKVTELRRKASPVVEKR